MLFWLRCTFAPWWVFLSFIASLSLWLLNEKVRSWLRGINELYDLYLLCRANGQVHVCLIASSIKIINKCNVLPYTDSSQPRWFHIETYMYVLGLWFSIQLLLLKSLSSAYDDRLVDRFHYVLIHIMNYEIRNILCLKK